MQDELQLLLLLFLIPGAEIAGVHPCIQLSNPSLLKDKIFSIDSGPVGVSTKEYTSVLLYEDPLRHDPQMVT